MAQDWLSGYFENKSFINASIDESVDAIVIADNVVIYEPLTGLLTYNDGLEVETTTPPLPPSYTLAEIVALTAEEVLAFGGTGEYIHIIDVHHNADGIGGVLVLRESSPSGWAQIGGPWYFEDVADMPDPAEWPDLRTVAYGVGKFGTSYKSNGSIYVLDQPESVIASAVAPTKAGILPENAWTAGISSVTDNGSSSYTIKSSAAHGLTAAQTTTGGILTYLPITGGTGWTAGLFLITDVVTNANWITVTGSGSTNTPTLPALGEGVEVDRVTIPPLNIYSAVSVEATWGMKGASIFNLTAALLYDDSSTYSAPAESSSCLWFYGATISSVDSTERRFKANSPHIFFNSASVSLQKTTYPRSESNQGGVASSAAMTTSTINSAVEKTLKLVCSASVANCRFWIDNYKIVMRNQ